MNPCSFDMPLYWFLVSNQIHSVRLLCTLEGTYLIQQNCAEADSFIEHDEVQSFSFSCVIPNIVGRGFIEVI